jgi:hypothetical protein
LKEITILILLLFQLKATMETKASVDADSLEIQKIYDSSVLGYAKMSFANFSDMDKGPQLTLRKYNPRPTTTSGLAKLMESAQNGKLVVNMTPMNAIIVAAPASFIDLTTLTLNTSGRIQDVGWTAFAKNAKEGDVVLGNGAHRATLVHTHLHPEQVKQWELLKGKVARAKQEGVQNSSKAKETLQHLMNLEPKLRELTSWLVLFLNKGLTFICSIQS